VLSLLHDSLHSLSYFMLIVALLRHPFTANDFACDSRS
jgi:hypothetical protein